MTYFFAQAHKLGFMMCQFHKRLDQLNVTINRQPLSWFKPDISKHGRYALEHHFLSSLYVWCMLVFISLWLCSSSATHAELYTYVDEDGVTMITSEYRKGAHVIDGIEEHAP